MSGVYNRNTHHQFFQNDSAFGRNEENGFWSKKKKLSEAIIVNF
jgi:hypothetical protein